MTKRKTQHHSKRKQRRCSWCGGDYNAACNEISNCLTVSPDYELAEARKKVQASLTEQDRLEARELQQKLKDKNERKKD